MRTPVSFLAAATILSVSAVRVYRRAQHAKRDTSGSNRAIVSLLYGKFSPSLLNVRTMMNSARRHGSEADRVVMVPQGDPALEFRSLLESDGVQVVEVPVVEVPPGMRGVDPGRWGKVLTKFMAFNLTAYDRVLLIDGDAYFAGNGDPDQIFDECGSYELCVTEDGNPEDYVEDCPDDPSMCRQVNTGVVVFTPSADRFRNILEEAFRDHRAYHYVDQQFLSRYLRTHNASMPWKLLDPYWNCCGMSKPEPADPESRVWIGHMCGGWGGSWDHKFCTEKPNCPPKLRAWQLEALAMDVCLGRKTESACTTHRECGWCGTYCMDQRMDCTNITFDIGSEGWGQSR